MEENKTLSAQQGETQAKKSTGGRRIRPMVLMFEPVFDNNLNMALDYAAKVVINDSKMGVMLPEYYTPVAEKSNRICEINRWAVEECCDVLKRADARDASINSFILDLSVKYLAKPYFCTQIMKILEKKEVEADKFCFNISENIYATESEQVKKNIAEMREHGAFFTIDDLGVEYTSMSNLSHYEVDYIGINRKMIEPINPELYEDEDRPRIVVQGLVDFAKKLGVKTIADGVDTPELAALLTKMGVRRLKGKNYCTDLWEEKKIK